MAAVIVAVIAESGGSSSARGRSGGPAVSVTPRLKRVLSGEIARLRAGQPTAPRVAPLLPGSGLPGSGLPLNPERGIPCFVAGTARCSEIPCREFVTGQAVLKLSATVTKIGTAGSTGPAVARGPGSFSVNPGAATLKVGPRGPTLRIAPGALSLGIGPGAAPLPVGPQRATEPTVGAAPPVATVPPAPRPGPTCRRHKGPSLIPISAP
ncbi:MAG TPA: hypothetical protein VG275_04680 [Solirubrobacteraceae bacterium]|nr:hypothetical protein [Solirubrobacteraceae bacterium]